MKQHLFFIIFCLALPLWLMLSQAAEASNKRMIILFDQNGIEKVGGMSAGTSVLALALHQKACSILTSYSIFNAFLERKYSSNPEPLYRIINFNCSDWKIYYLKNSNFFFLTPTNEYSLIQDTANNGYLSYETIDIKEKDIEQEISESKTLIIPLIKTQSLDLFSSNPRTPEALRIWINQKKQLNNLFSIEQLESLFFHENDFKTMQPLLDQLSFINQIQARKISGKEISYATSSKPIKFAPHKIAAQARDLIQTKLDFIRSATKPWNFYVFGHGSYENPPQITTVGETTRTSYSVPIVADLWAIDEKKMNPATGRPNQLTPFLFFFNKINTNLIALSSCYSGGKNLNYLRFKEGLKQEKIANNLNYILAVLSSSDAPSTSPTSWQLFTEMTTYPGGKTIKKTTESIDFEHSVNPARFFDMLEGTEVARSATLKNPEIRHQISTALAQLSLHLKSNLTQNIPQVLAPGLDWFYAWEPPKDTPHSQVGTVTIGNVAIKKSLIDKKPLRAHDKKAILLYESLIPTPLEITPIIHQNPKENEEHRKKLALLPDNYHAGIQGIKAFSYPIILSMKHGPATHIFESINLLQPKHATLKNTGILSFLRDAFCNTQDRLSRKVFFIHSLTGYNDFSPILAAIRAAKKQANITALEQHLESKKDQVVELRNIIIDTTGAATNYAELFKSIISIAFQLFDNTFWRFEFNEMFTIIDANGYIQSATLAQARWAFNKISEQDYETLKKSKPELMIKIQEFKNYEKLDWKIVKPEPKPEPEPKSDFANKLETLHQQLAKLKAKLDQLSTNLKQLRTKLSSPGSRTAIRTDSRSEAIPQNIGRNQRIGRTHRRGSNQSSDETGTKNDPKAEHKRLNRPRPRPRPKNS